MRIVRARCAVVLVGLAMVGTLTGCGGEAAVSGTAPTASASLSATTSGQPSGQATSRGENSVVTLDGARDTQVENVSRTVACVFSSDLAPGRADVRCDVEGTWHLTAPADCHGGYGDSADLDSFHGPSLGCHTDTVFLAEGRVIPTGSKVVYRDLVCVFGPASVTCENEHQDRFTVSPSSYSFE